MSNVISAAVEALSAKMSGEFDGSAKFVIEDEGAIVVDSDGVRAGDDETDLAGGQRLPVRHLRRETAEAIDLVAAGHLPQPIVGTLEVTGVAVEEEVTE